MFELGDDYILYKIHNITQKIPSLNDNKTRNEILELISQKNKYEYNMELLEKIRNKKFSNNDFLETFPELIPPKVNDSKS